MQMTSEGMKKAGYSAGCAGKCCLDHFHCCPVERIRTC
jgi:hypothetical protein